MHSWFPGNVLYLQQVSGVACQNKEIITQSVQVLDDQRLNKEVILHHIHAEPFGTPANTAGDMGCGDGHMAAREDE